jgi:uncharacterized protein involved in exopolysaccharide biosynthesis
MPPRDDEAAEYWQELARGHRGMELKEREQDTLLRQVEAELARHHQQFIEHAKVINQHSDAVDMFIRWQKQTIQRLEALEGQVSRLSGSGFLTPEHQAELRTLLRALAHQTQQPQSEIEKVVAAAFGVDAPGQLPEAKWGEIAAWLSQRLGWA